MVMPQSACCAGRCCRIRLRQGFGGTGRDSAHLFCLQAVVVLRQEISVAGESGRGLPHSGTLARLRVLRDYLWLRLKVTQSAYFTPEPPKMSRAEPMVRST